jgi:GTP 3',8-cyclase
VSRTAELDPRPETSLTTNGIGLARTAAQLRDAGLEEFRKLACRDRLPGVLDGLSAAAGVGLTPVKVNTVLMRGINDSGAPELLR